MARYGAEHKARTRQRIIESAGRRLKQDGIDGSGLATLMADAGLTNGAFYAHFESKDDLVDAAVGDQLAAQSAVLAALPEGRTALGQYVREYLTPHHRDHPDTGCPDAALLDGVGRCGDAVRGSYTLGVQSIIDVIARHLSPQNPSHAHTRALGLFTVLVATLQLARAVSDRVLSDGILSSGILNAQILLECEHYSSESCPGQWA